MQIGEEFMIYDCIIAGAGPAGTLCGYLLAASGYRCLILEKLEAYGEKVCGGWLPNIALEELREAGIDVDTFAAGHGAKTKSCLTSKGEKESVYTYPDGVYGFGTARKELDSFLGEEAVRAGARLVFGTEVNEIEYKDGLYYVNGFCGKTFVASTGARGLIHNRNEIYEGQSFGISAQIIGKTSLDPKRVYFWYENEETRDYFWAIPIGTEKWNIGYWQEKPGKDIMEHFRCGICKYIESSFSEFEYVILPKGAFLGNVDLLPYLEVPAFGAGDFAGTNRATTGEGLSFALRSAEKAAYQVRKMLGEDIYERMEFVSKDGVNVCFLCDRIQYFEVSEAEKKALQFLVRGGAEEEARKISQLTSEKWDKLLKRIYKRAEQLPMDVKTQTVRLTFNVSNCCNMACKYCYAQGGSYHSEENKMSVETAKKALDLFYKKYDKISSIKFIGGEPAMNLDVVEFICKYHEEKLERNEIRKLPEFIFVTNGTIVTDQLIRLANLYQMKIGFSLDGRKEHNDLVRVFKNGSGTTDIVVKNIRKLQEATGGREPYSINAVYTELEAKEQVSIADIVHYIKDELHVPSVHIIPVDVQEDSPYFLSDNQQFIDAANALLEEWKTTGEEYFFAHIKGIIKKIERRLCSPDYICDAGVGLFSISAKGEIYPCHLFTDLDEFCLGNVEDDFFQNEAYQKFREVMENFNRRELEPCKSCFANRLCIGCLGANYFRTGDKYTPSPFICGMFQEVVKLVLATLVVREREKHD